MILYLAGLGIYVELSTILFGAFVFFMGFFFWHFLHGLKVRGIECYGRISSFEEFTNGSRIPYVEFVASNGFRVNKTLSLQTRMTNMFILNGYVNEQVLIVYDSHKPERFILKSDRNNNKFFAFISMGFGVLIIIVSVCSLLGYINIFELLPD